MGTCCSKSCEPLSAPLHKPFLVESIMKAPKFESEWEGFKGHVIVKWDKISNDELLHIEGNFADLVALIAGKYGETKESVEKKLHELYDSYIQMKHELKKEFVGLRDNLQSHSEAIAESVRQKASDLQKNAKEKIGKIRSENIDPAVQKSEEYIKVHPFTAVLGALGIGMLLGGVFVLFTKKD
jgi:ElaB/YqjD/DUF883 family membrane-anchored ribosome-binding protein